MPDVSDEITRLILSSRILFAVIGLPMFILGILGNFLSLFVFSYIPQLNKLPSAIFLFSSLIASQIVLIIAFLPQLIYRISGIDLLGNSIIICKIRSFLGPLCGTLALHYIGLAAIKQYLIISRRIRYHQFLNRQQAIYITIFLGLFWIGPLCPSVVFYTHTIDSFNVTTCNIIDPIFAIYFTYISVIIYSLIPMFVLSIVSLLIWWKVRNNITRQRRLERTLTRMLLAQMIMILLTSIPNLLNQLYFFYTKSLSKSIHRRAEETIISSIFTLIATSPLAFSFYIYFLASKTFRRRIQYLCFSRQYQVEPMRNIQHYRSPLALLQPRI